MKELVSYILMALGVVLLAKIIGLDRYLQVGVRTQNLPVRILNVSAGNLPEAVSVADPATRYSQEAEKLLALVKARKSYNEIWSACTQWPAYDLVSSCSPILKPLVYCHQITDGSEGKGEGESEGRVADIKVQVKIQGATEAIWADLQSVSTQKTIPFYWDSKKPILVDTASVIRSGGWPMELVPAAQRSPDGLTYVTAWVYREDVRTDDFPKVPWARSILRTNTEENGRRQFIDRYTVLLQRGQSSQVLSYSPAPLEEWEKEQNFFRCWRIRVDEEATLLVNVNGQPYVIWPGAKVDSSEVEREDGSLVVSVTLAKEAPQKEIPVEFIYYREKKVGERGDI